MLADSAQGPVRCTRMFGSWKSVSLTHDVARDGGRGFENIRESLGRAERVAQWIKMPSMAAELGSDGCLVIVSHADFLALLMAAMTKQNPAGAGMNPDHDISAHGVSEATLQQSMGQVDVESVYRRNRISLACTTLLEIERNGIVKVLWMNKKSHLQVGCTLS